MLSPGPLAAPATCLRCQLRSVIFRTRPAAPCLALGRPGRCEQRGLHLATTRWQEAKADSGDEVDKAYQPFAPADEEDGLKPSQLKDDGLVREERGRDRSVNHDVVRWKENEGSGHHSGQRLSVYPQGRVFGKPGQRQRETSTTLQSQAMGKPFDITIMHDILDSFKEWEEDKYRDSSAVKDKVAKVPIALQEDPTHEEVQESIQALRPNANVLEEKDMLALAKDLSRQYNTKQLYDYLATTLELDRVEGDPIQVRPTPPEQPKGSVPRSFWKAGRSPITERTSAPYEIRKQRMSKKSVVEQILRLAWKLHTTTELQSMGEVELSLTSWQFNYLFALTGPAGEPMHQAMITTPLLRKTAEIRPYEPENIMRISARRGDAIEIADQIDSGLNDITSLYTDLTVFKSLFEPDDYREKLQTIFSPSLRADIGRRTSTVIELPDITNLVVHGQTKESTHLARRTLLMFLDLPLPKTAETHEMIIKKPKADRLRNGDIDSNERVFGLEYGTSELDLRYRTMRLGRAIVPSQALVKSDSDASPASVPPTVQTTPSPGTTHTLSALHRFTRDRQVVQYLSSLEPFMPFEGRPTQFGTALWRHPYPLRHTTWQVELGKRLSEQPHEEVPDADKMPTPQSNTSVKQTYIPHQGRLLSYFSPVAYEKDGTSEETGQALTPRIMRAHFMPSPFGEHGVDIMRNLPRIELAYNKAEPDSKRPVSVMATLSRQEVHVTLPAEAVDLCFVRTMYLDGDIERTSQMGFADFNEKATLAMATDQAPLEYCDVVQVELPTWMVHPASLDSESSKPYTSVPYLFNGWEAVQSADFAPVLTNQQHDSTAPPTERFVRVVPEAVSLRYSEIDSGPFGGRRSETTVFFKQLRFVHGHNQGKKVMVVYAGLDLARKLTKFASGDMKGRWEYSEEELAKGLNALKPRKFLPFE